jgi:hypothetical protein
LVDLLSKDGNKLVEILPGPQQVPEEWEKISYFRRELGEVRPLIHSPGHLFKSGNRDEFHRLLSLAMEAEDIRPFYVYCAPSRTTLLVGQRMEIWSPKKGTRNELARYLAPQQAA